MARLLERLSYANVMATVAVFVALGGGAYALSQSSPPVRGGGKIVSSVLGASPGPFQRLVKLPGIGKITVSCGTNAQSSGWGFLTARHAADIVTTDGSGTPSASAIGHVSGHHHGFSGAFAGHGPTFPAAQEFIQLSTGAGAGAKSATVELSVLNGGDPSPLVNGIGNKCRFRAQTIRQP